LHEGDTGGEVEVRKGLWLAASLLVAVALLVGGCQSGAATFADELPSNAQKITLEEADSIIGAPLPLPTYLPKGCEIQEVYAVNSGVAILFSDKEIEKELVSFTDASGPRQRYDFQCKMEMDVRWYSEDGIPVRLPGEKVEFNGCWGFILDEGDHNALWWNWCPDPGEPGMFELVLTASKSISRKGLVRVAASALY
jgi:hypothetical protein